MKHWSALVLALAVALALSPAALAEAPLVTVSATGSVAYPPDTAMITLGVSESAKTTVEAQSIVNEKIAAVRAALAAAGVEDADISVGSLSLWDRGDSSLISRKTTYTASHALTVTTRDVGAVGPLIDAALAAGANRLQGVSFSVKGSSEAYDRALAVAVQKARAKAGVLADAAGVGLGALQSLTEEGGGYTSRSMAANVVMSGGGAPTEVDSGLVTISATVTAVYALEN